MFNDSPIIGVADAFALASMWRVRMVGCPFFGKVRSGQDRACGKVRSGQDRACIDRIGARVGRVHFGKRTEVIQEN